jgi:hypothetical protein
MLEDGEVIDSENLKVHPRMKELYKFFKFNGKVVDIDDVDPHTLEVFSREVLKMIANGKSGWEEMLPKGIAELIKQHQLFGYDPNKILEENQLEENQKSKARNPKKKKRQCNCPSVQSK